VSCAPSGLCSVLAPVMGLSAPSFVGQNMHLCNHQHDNREPHGCAVDVVRVDERVCAPSQ
jgi:hypothetical protein